MACEINEIDRTLDPEDGTDGRAAVPIFRPGALKDLGCTERKSILPWSMGHDELLCGARSVPGGSSRGVENTALSSLEIPLMSGR